MSNQNIPYERPPTPQAMLHRLPDKSDSPSDGTTKPSKYIVLIMGSTGVAGKVQIASTVAKALSCPLYQGDSLHESSAKAASVGASRRTGAAVDDATAGPGVNEGRYQRMWLSKMTRTGLLFPDESRPANEGFSGFGGSSSSSTSRRGSNSSVASELSDAAVSTASSIGSSVISGPPTGQYINKPPVFTVSEEARLRKANPVLLVLTHPQLEKWHQVSIRKATGEYGIGIIFIPLYKDQDEDEDEELPILRPLDPRTMTSFRSLGGFGGGKKAVTVSLEEETILRIDVESDVEDIIEEIVDSVQDIMRAV